jgi:hypothetical protein
MKNWILWMVFLQMPFAQAQEKTTQIEEVIIKSKPSAKNAMAKLRKNLEKDIDTATYVYQLIQCNTQNADTIINRNEQQTIKLIDFNGNFVKKNVIENKDNWFTNIKTTFAKYNSEESPIGWISGFPVRKNITVANLDFIKNNKAYTYTTEWFEDNLLKINFTSFNFYKGHIVVDQSYKLVSIFYEVQTPYPFFYSSKESIGKNHKFTSNWKYQKEKVQLTFGKNEKNKVHLHSIQIEEKLQDFVFNRYDENGVVFTENNNFTTQILLEKVD